jgi:hypothetical protein
LPFAAQAGVLLQSPDKRGACPALFALRIKLPLPRVARGRFRPWQSAESDWPAT